MKIICSLKCAEYSKEEEPEAPFRIKDSYAFLKEKGYSFINPDSATEKDILRVHSKEFLDSIKTRGEKNPEIFDSDLVKYENIFYYASLSAGAAIIAMENCFNDYSFSLMRPPGHHAGKKAEGFCFLNNMAIAVKKAFSLKKAKKIAIIDIDLHHGNGTQDIFLNDDRVLFVSLHQSPEYPGTGLVSESNCINFPLSPGTEEKKYLEKLEEGIKKIKEFNPDIIGVSAGFDTYKEDPLGRFKLEIASYEKIARMIKEIGKPVFSVLEGGYSSKLKYLVYSYIKGFEN